MKAAIVVLFFYYLPAIGLTFLTLLGGLFVVLIIILAYGDVLVFLDNDIAVEKRKNKLKQQLNSST